MLTIVQLSLTLCLLVSSYPSYYANYCPVIPHYPVRSKSAKCKVEVGSITSSWHCLEHLQCQQCTHVRRCRALVQSVLDSGKEQWGLDVNPMMLLLLTGGYKKQPVAQWGGWEGLFDITRTTVNVRSWHTWLHDMVVGWAKVSSSSCTYPMWSFFSPVNCDICHC